MTCWRRREGRSEGSFVVSVCSTRSGSGDEPKMSSRELSTGWASWVDIVVAGDGGADWVELESVCAEAMAVSCCLISVEVIVGVVWRCDKKKLVICGCSAPPLHQSAVCSMVAKGKTIGNE